METDISDLLNDKRLPPNTMVEVNKDQLEITFPSGEYKVIPEFSELKDEGKTWSLYIFRGGGGIAAFNKLKYEIPKGVEKIILKEVNP